jgi:hypothetical protein
MAVSSSGSCLVIGSRISESIHVISLPTLQPISNSDEWHTFCLLIRRLTNWPSGGLLSLPFTRPGVDIILAQTLDGEIQQALFYIDGKIIPSVSPPFKSVCRGKLVANKFDSEIFLSISPFLCQVFSFELIIPRFLC